MRIALLCATLCLATLAGCAAPPPATPVDRAALERQAGDTERAFAKTMVDRDLAAFSNFLADETVFFSGPVPLHGKQAVTEFWKRFYDKATPPPFSWRPDQAQALASGTLALTTGPVFDPVGKCIGRFTSIWRQEAPGVWRIVFDKGGPCSDK